MPTETEIANRMKIFLSLNNGLKFISSNTEQLKKQLNDLFGSNFSININDMLKTCLSSDEGNIYEIITKYIKQPKIETNIDPHTIKCDIDNLIIPQVLTVSLKAFSLSLLYPKFINPINNKVKSASDQKNIQFSSKWTPDDLQFSCSIGESYNIEFFEGILTPVHLIDANSDLTEYLQKISEDQTIFIDLKSVQTYVYNKKMTPEEQKEVPYIGGTKSLFHHIKIILI